MATRTRDLFGQGLGFPPRIGADGRLVWSSGEDNVRESIQIILLTEPGERLMREGILVKDTHGSTIRLAPPLVISADDLNLGLDQLEGALS